jgi:hypothetical protein
MTILERRPGRVRRPQLVRGLLGELHDDIDGVLLAQFVGEGFEPVQPTRHQNQRVALRRVLAGSETGVTMEAWNSAGRSLTRLTELPNLGKLRS